MDREQRLKEKTEQLRKKLDKLIEKGASAQDILAASLELDECFKEYFKLEKEKKREKKEK